jgi:hypothetical protein
MKWLLKSGRYALDFLLYNEIVTKIVQKPSQSTPKDSSEAPEDVKFSVTQLGAGILRAGLSPDEGLLVYVDLQHA